MHIQGTRAIPTISLASVKLLVRFICIDSRKQSSGSIVGVRYLNQTTLMPTKATGFERLQLWEIT
jgi:hypothetical protein